MLQHVIHCLFDLVVRQLGKTALGRHHAGVALEAVDGVTVDHLQPLLQAAVDTGSDTLVTACPKCMIHLKCAQSGDEGAAPNIEIRDLATVVAGALNGKSA